MPPSITRIIRLTGALALLGLALGLGFVAGRRLPLGLLVPAAPRLMSNPFWTEVTTAPLVRYEGGAVAIADRVYLFGGFYNRRIQATSRVDVFDRASRSWTRARDMPVAFTHANAALLRDTVWFAGGFEGDSPGRASARVWRYDPGTDAWSEGPSLPEPRGGGALVALEGTLHYFGGWKADRNTDAAEHWVLEPGSRWRAAAPMPNPRGHLAGVALQGRIYAIGGCVGHDPVPVDMDLVDRYDPAADRWEAVASLPIPRSHIEASTFVHSDRIVVIGGRSRPAGLQSVSDVSEYDPVTNRWGALPRIPLPLLGPVGLPLGDSLLVGVGADASSNPENAAFWMAAPWTGWVPLDSLPLALQNVSAGILGDRLYLVGERNPVTLVLDLARGTWAPPGVAAARPAMRGQPAAEVLGGSLYLLGGYSGNQGLMQIYDPETNHWRLGPPMPFAAGSLASAVIAGRIYVAGGVADQGTPGQAAVYDPATTKWTALPPMPAPRSRAASGTDGTRLYVFGGIGPAGTPQDTASHETDTVQIYDPAANSWTVSAGAAGAPAPLPQPRAGMGRAVFHRGEFYLLGGSTTRHEAGPSASVSIYNPATNTWHSGVTMPHPRQGGFPLLHDGRIYVGGGSVRPGVPSALLEVLVP